MGNVRVYPGGTWAEIEAFRDVFMAEHKPGDFCTFDFVTEMWTAAQEGFLLDAVGKTRGQSLYEQGVKGKTGWEMFSAEMNWNAINGSYFDVVKKILVQSKAHIFMVAEEEEIAENKQTAEQKEHVAQFGRYKAKGQKRLAYQCRSYLRVQRLARGRVLYTLKDRARKELKGDTIESDFFTFYMKGVAGWSVGDASLVEKNNLREKILLIGPAGAGKTTAHLSIAWWAYQAGDDRTFWILDTDDDAVLHVMDEEKYEGMLHSVDGVLV